MNHDGEPQAPVDLATAFFAGRVENAAEWRVEGPTDYGDAVQLVFTFWPPRKGGLAGPRFPLRVCVNPATGEADMLR